MPIGRREVTVTRDHNVRRTPALGKLRKGLLTDGVGFAADDDGAFGVERAKWEARKVVRILRNDVPRRRRDERHPCRAQVIRNRGRQVRPQDGAERVGDHRLTATEHLQFGKRELDPGIGAWLIGRWELRVLDRYAALAEFFGKPPQPVGSRPVVADSMKDQHA